MLRAQDDVWALWANAEGKSTARIFFQYLVKSEERMLAKLQFS